MDKRSQSSFAIVHCTDGSVLVACYSCYEYNKHVVRRLSTYGETYSIQFSLNQYKAHFY